MLNTVHVICAVPIKSTHPFYCRIPFLAFINGILIINLYSCLHYTMKTKQHSQYKPGRWIQKHFEVTEHPLESI